MRKNTPRLMSEQTWYGVVYIGHYVRKKQYMNLWSKGTGIQR